MSQTNLTLDAIEKLAFDALSAAGANEKNARIMARATREIEAEGISSHGLAYIPIYAEHVQCGKVQGDAEPVVEKAAPSLLRVDAQNGFAHPAIDAGFEALVPLAKSQGIAAMAVHQSYNCAILGTHTKRLAKLGLVGIGFTNAPASIAPAGGDKPVIGTNPFSVATPSSSGEPGILIDQSASAIAKSEVMKHAREGKPIPLGWALDEHGEPTTDAAAALKGSMAPSGGYKGVGIGLFVEITAAALTGAHLGVEASPFSGTQGGPPATGQFFMAIDPNASSNGAFESKITTLTVAISSQNGARIPGERRAQNWEQSQSSGVMVNNATLEKINQIIDGDAKS